MRESVNKRKKVQYVLRLLEIKGGLISDSFSALKKCELRDDAQD